ncbi:MAG: hypothetical protein KAJ72_05280, partial [Candidatus Heimdallarchaeota archaeon]|nr:hypothetical protein [Candidatus Heimdallarchaeota archaeon]
MFRGLSKGSKASSIIILAYLLIFSITLTSLKGITATNTNDYLGKDNLKGINPIDQIPNLLEDYSSYPYTPVTNLSGSGNNCDVEDILTVYDDFSLNLTYNSLTGYFEDNFTNVDITSAYDASMLNYNMTEILAKRDYYIIEAEQNSFTILEESRPAIAQSFEVKWDYANFSGAKLYLEDTGQVTGTNMELIVVKADEVTGAPDMSYNYTIDLNGPYNSTNRIPIGFLYYDFEDVVLEKGKYFVVAILADPSSASPKYFMWYRNTVLPYASDTYYQNIGQTWDLQASSDHTLIVEMLPSNQTGYAMEFQDLSTITMKDNGVDIQNIDSQITSIGFHNLTSDTSLEITFNNSYNFINSITADSYFAAFNSTAGDYSIYWNLTWDVSSVNPSPFSIYERKIQVATVSDWYDSPTCYYNETNTFPIILSSDTYLCYLDSNTSAGYFRLETSSPNFIQSLELSNEVEQTNLYSLGYWT